MPYPIKRVDFSKDHWDHVKIRGAIAFMCPHCLGLTYLTGSMTINLKNEINNPIWVEPVYHITCNECGEKYTTTDDPLDPNIAPIISMLNRKGYETLFSCEGHKYPYNNETCPSQFYIYFKEFKYIKLVEKYPLPGLFSIEDYDTESNKFVIRAAMYSMDKDAPSSKDLCDAIRLWARRLPNAEDFDKVLEAE